MTFFLIGLGAGVALALAILALVVALDKRRYPECAMCCLAIPAGTGALCPRCRELAEMAELGGKP